MTVVNNSAPRTHPNDKLRYIPKSGMSRDHTRTGSRRSRCLGGVAEVRPCETGWQEGCLNRPALQAVIFRIPSSVVVSAAAPPALPSLLRNSRENPTDNFSVISFLNF
jgi:hypothetical protein